MRILTKCVLALAVSLLPATVFAQASLTGTVRDASGAVLPGVTVEASSPALIERSRTAVTDGSGQYRIIDLRPGIYSMTFTLAGFSTVRRDNIELTGTQTLTIPVDMKVGVISETITVSAESPVVDIQNARREIVLHDEDIQALPAARSAGALLNATPGLFVDTNGPALSPTMTFFNARSSTINSTFVAGEGRMTVNGYTVAAARSGGVSSYVYDTPNADEVATVVSGGLGESDVGGPVMNLVPRSGGNTFAGTAFTNLAGDWSNGDNLTDELKALNTSLRQTPGVIEAYDWSASYGGPIQRDRLWFYGSYRSLDTQQTMDGISANANAGNPSRWDWVGAPNVPARLVQDRQMIIGRVTGQFGKHRVRYNSEYQKRCEGTPLNVETPGCHNRGDDWIGLGNNAPPTQQSPEATSTAARGYFDVPFYVNQGTWTMNASSKLLLEAGYTAFRYNPIFGQPPPDGITTLIPVTEQSNTINSATGLQYAPVPNYTYRGIQQWGPAVASTDGWQATASYVTGAHNMKLGYQGNRLDIKDQNVANQTGIAYRFNQGVPNAVSYWLPDMARRTITSLHGFFIQDTWTRDRLTLQGALRYDRASSFAPVEGNGTTMTSFLAPTPITIQETPGVDAYHDLTPRVGVAYDLFGNGKTALKFNYGSYLAYAANDSPYTSTNPGATIIRDVQNRGWNATVAAGGNGDLVVNCDLTNPGANGECAAATGPAVNFGKPNLAQQVNPDILRGWGVRPGDRQYMFTLQQEIVPRVSADFSYSHRSFHGFFVTDDLTRRAGSVASYYNTYTLTAPQDPRLPGGGGYPITTYVPTDAANAVLQQLYLTSESDFGPERKSVWDGFDYALTARPSASLTVQVGASTGRGLVDTCETATNYNRVQTGLVQQTLGPDPRGCHDAEPWQTGIRGLASYTIPKIDVLLSGVVRSQPEMLLGATPATAATWQVPNSVVVSALGYRPSFIPANLAGTQNIPLGHNDQRIYADTRRTAVDMRIAKVIRFGRARADVGVDLNNIFNTNYPTGYNTTYIFNTDNAPRVNGWGTPTSIFYPRFMRLNFTVNF
jgi:Carboxypeptidase regulatory-like domain